MDLDELMRRLKGEGSMMDVDPGEVPPMSAEMRDQIEKTMPGITAAVDATRKIVNLIIAGPGFSALIEQPWADEAMEAIGATRATAESCTYTLAALVGKGVRRGLRAQGHDLSVINFSFDLDDAAPEHWRWASQIFTACVSADDIAALDLVVAAADRGSENLRDVFIDLCYMLEKSARQGLEMKERHVDFHVPDTL